MAVLKEINVTDSEISRINEANTELVTLRNLIKELDENSSEFIFNKLITKLKSAQLEYDQWFSDMSVKYNIVTTPENRWNVDFSKKVLQLL